MKKEETITKGYKMTDNAVLLEFKYLGTSLINPGNSYPRPIYYRITEDGCHICTSHRGKSKGYTQIARDRKQYLLHRLVYRDTKLKGSEIPPTIQVLHKCDNPACINPDHLSLGTNEDNMRDKAAKGRVNSPFKPGSLNVMAKLSEKDVMEILIDKEHSSYELGSIYGVAAAHIRSIRLKRTWKHISES